MVKTSFSLIAILSMGMLAQSAAAASNGFGAIAQCIHNERALLDSPQTSGPSNEAVISSFESHKATLDGPELVGIAMSSENDRDFDKKRKAIENDLPTYIDSAHSFLISSDGATEVTLSRRSHWFSGERLPVSFDVNGRCVSSSIDTENLSGHDYTLDAVANGKCSHGRGETQVSGDVKADAYDAVFEEELSIIRSLGKQLSNKETQHLLVNAEAPVEKNYEKAIDGCINAFKNDYAPNEDYRARAITALQKQKDDLHLRTQQAKAAVAAVLSGPLPSGLLSSAILMKDLFDNVGGNSSPAATGGAHVTGAH